VVDAVGVVVVDVSEHDDAVEVLAAQRSHGAARSLVMTRSWSELSGATREPSGRHAVESTSDASHGSRWSMGVLEASNAKLRLDPAVQNHRNARTDGPESAAGQVNPMASAMLVSSVLTLQASRLYSLGSCRDPLVLI
jgi:hypothetical protein